MTCGSSNECVTRQTDRQTNQPTDTSRYKGALSHLKKPVKEAKFEYSPVNEWGLRIVAFTFSKVWQLFVDGEMMTNARWPNARWSDKSVFDASLWGKSTRETTEKRLYDRNRKLSKVRNIRKKTFWQKQKTVQSKKTEKHGSLTEIENCPRWENRKTRVSDRNIKRSMVRKQRNKGLWQK